MQDLKYLGERTLSNKFQFQVNANATGHLGLIAFSRNSTIVLCTWKLPFYLDCFRIALEPEAYIVCEIFGFLTPICISRNRSVLFIRESRKFFSPPFLSVNATSHVRDLSNEYSFLLVHLPKRDYFGRDRVENPHGHEATSSVPLDTSK